MIYCYSFPLCMRACNDLSRKKVRTSDTCYVQFTTYVKFNKELLLHFRRNDITY